jgi:hypothetical protein
MKKSCLVPLAFCVSLTCQAESYYLTPVFRADERYYSNLFLREKPLQDNWITTLSPGLSFGILNEDSSLTSNFTWNHLFYTNQSELDIDEQLFSLGYQHQPTERLQWGIDGSYNNRSSLNTEGTINGLLFTQVMSKQLNLAPSISYGLDERNSLAVDYSYNNTDYDESQNSALTDYDYHQLSGTYSHLYSERDKLSVTLSSSRYKSTLQDQTIFNHVAQLGWQHSFEEQWTSALSAGLNYSQTSVTVPLLTPVLFQGRIIYVDPATGVSSAKQRYKDQESGGFGAIYNASIKKIFERGSATLTASQNQSATSGGLQTQTRITLDTEYAVDDRWNTGFSTGYSTYETTGQQNSLNNRTSYSFSPRITWKWTPELNLLLSYTFLQQEFDRSAQPSLGNTVQFTFLYQPQINHQVK